MQENTFYADYQIPTENPENVQTHESDGIILYTTHCPKCRVLETKLQRKNIQYVQFTDTEKMIEIGLRSAPYLKVNEKMMDFVEANNYINSL